METRNPQSLSQFRCYLYPDRPAVARCPSCKHYFSRECITEHDGRVICTSCLDTFLAEKDEKRGGISSATKGWVLAAVGVCVLYFIFYLLGQHLASLPTADFRTYQNEPIP